jgi:uncharacterized pyridoxal phosphate-dependent enzyme
MMDIYDDLGVTKVINGFATVTFLGGSLMPPEVVAAMAEAAQHFVDIDELQLKVGRRIAEWTHNEAAYVSCGAGAGIVLSTAACMAGMDPARRDQLPDTTGMKNEVIIHRSGRVAYDRLIRSAGAKVVLIGTMAGAAAADLEAAINERTAAVFYFWNVSLNAGQIPLEEVIAIAHARGVPAIVDAAAQLPPVENLWRFTQMGADLALFSGGKGLCGPQSSGLILGRQDLIEAIAFHACPRAAIGRPMKTGKEEIVGLMAAVKWYLGLDQAELLDTYERQVRYVIDQLAGLPCVTARRNFPSEAGQPMPRAEIVIDETGIGHGPRKSRDAILAELRTGEPAIALAPSGDNGFFVNPQTLEVGQERIIAARLREVLGGSGE